MTTRNGQIQNFFFYSICATIYFRVFLSRILRNFLGAFPLVKNVPKSLRLYLVLSVKIVFLLGLSKFFISLGYVFMDDLSRAVSQFYPFAPGGMSGGFNQPPAPEGYSAIPVFQIENETLDQPGPSASEGEGRAGRDYSAELENIAELQKDKSLNRSFRNALISHEKIIIEMKKSILSGNNISDDDIRRGVDIYLTEIMEISNMDYRNRRLSRILRDLTDRGSASPYFYPIVKEIESLNSLLFRIRSSNDFELS